MMRNFLRGAKFSLETAKRKLEGYFWAKVAYPNFYQRRVPGDVKTAQIVFEAGGGVWRRLTVVF
mgnify:CR=1 FL=1